MGSWTILTTSWRGRPRIWWVLAALTILTAALGIWNWQLWRQEIARQSQPSGSTESRAAAPDFSLPDLAGQEVSLSSLRGSVIMVNFWATWCKPCEDEMPDLDRLFTRYGEQHDFVVIAVNKEEPASTVQAFVSKQSLTFPILLDSDGDVTLNGFAVRALPTSFIIDREGKVRDVWQGQIAPEAMLARLQRVWLPVESE